MKKAISELITELEKEKKSAIESRKIGVLDEGFCKGLQAAYSYVIGTLESILVKKEDK